LPCSAAENTLAQWFSCDVTVISHCVILGYGIVTSKAQVLSRYLAGVAGSNSTESLDDRVLGLLCVGQVVACARGWSLVQRSATGYVCVCVCVYNCVWYRNLNSEAVWVRFGLLRHGNKRGTFFVSYPK
jgi:hypothetical protein